MDKINLCRAEMLLGAQAMNKLAASRVAVFGIGGVGSYCAEALARMGIGNITVVDDDVVAPSNLNRQLYALQSTVGQPKVDIAAARINDINPDCIVTKKRIRYAENVASDFDMRDYDYVVDAVDTVSAKLLLVQKCHDANVPIVSCMGTGNKLDPTAFRVADISQTTDCPLARVMRRELKKRGIATLKVVYSAEPPQVPEQLEVTAKRQTPGSISFVPPVAGMILASVVVKDLIKE